jgi:rubrerythrin
MTGELARRLTSLAQLDRDATGVYDEALKHVTDEDVRTAFTDFRDEHEHHITEISAALVRAGGPPLQLTVDTVGHLADWVTAVRSVGGQHGALQAMRTAETYHNKRYADAATWDVEDSALADALSRFYTEEQRHLAYVDAKLAVRAT